MPHALLLSPDDQAVSAITGVLEEMSVTCERPLDGVSAAQKLNSQSFDLVLVDCENLPAAKLIFDVCRRGKNGNHPVPIAIVDGRAGLPTAFRLGAELILTKPVAKDQARSTIRTAVSRVKKEGQTKDFQSKESAQPESATTPSGPASAPTSDEQAQAAVVAAVYSQLTNFSDPTSSSTSGVAANATSSANANTSPTATLSAIAMTMKMQSAVGEAEIAGAPAIAKSSPPSAPFSAPSSPKMNPAQALPVDSKPARRPDLSDDLVLGEIEKAERENSPPGKKGSAQRATTSIAPELSVPLHGQQIKKRSPLVALLLLVLAGAGLYAAWMYEPAFRAIAQPQIRQVLALTGIASPSPSGPSPAKPSAQHPRVVVPTSAPAPVTDPNNAPSAPAAVSTTGAPTGTADAAPTQPPATPSTAGTTAVSATAIPVAPAVPKPEAAKPDEIKKDAPNSPGAPLPGEESAIILSSKGAEKRLAHSIPPKYPFDARSAEGQGTVVLKEVVDETGKVAGVRLIEGNAALANAAIEAVKQWSYRPYVRDGKAQPFQTVVILDFQKP
jgi:protein TonB